MNRLMLWMAYQTAWITALTIVAASLAIVAAWTWTQTGG